MKKVCISKSWTFFSPDIKESIKIDIPHDFLIKQPRNPKSPDGAQNGFFDGTWGEYSKYVKFGSDAHYILDIDGAYACARIFFNDELLDMHPHGYTPYLADLSGKVKHGINNFIKITTQNIQPSTRWYSGAGLYRDVFLWSGGSVRIEPWDMFVKTLSAGKIEIDADITSDLDTSAEIAFSVYDADGREICSKSKTIEAKQGKNADITVFDIENPKLWDTDTPYLYTVKAVISVGGDVTDTFETKFGMRTISADAKNGFMLNGKSIKLRGGCVHHDHGALGSAELRDAVTRKIKLLKAAGFNALRTAHYPPSLTFLEICDAEGIIVMDEAFDMWNLPKNQLDYSLFFRDWWDRDIKYMVMRDRNHPSVVSYSIGNEIAESTCCSDGAKWAKRLSDEIRKYDSTRLVTSGICKFGDRMAPEDAPEDYKKFYNSEIYGDFGTKAERWAELTKEYMKPLDIVGYNYLYKRYESDSKKFPERVIWGSETHAVHFYDSWHEVMAHDNVIGDFTWTAYDNLGEAGTGRSLWARNGVIEGISLADYPWRTCYQGDLDLCGFRRPQSYYREAVWLGDCEPKIFTTHPKHYNEGFSGTEWHWYDVLDTWTFEDEYIGAPVKCDVYTDADEILFILNGRELGRVKPEKAIATMDIPYEKGELKAVAFKDGAQQKSSVLITTGSPDKISVFPELPADKSELLFFDIEISDANGNRIADASNETECEVYGGKLMAMFSGCPNNDDDYASNKCHVFQGRALAVVKRDPEADKTGVILKSDGLKCGTAAIENKL